MSRLVKSYKHLNSFTDRHGKVRHYFRAPNQKAIPVTGEFGSYEFDASYHAAMAQAFASKSPGENKVVKWTVNDLCVQYFQADEFLSLRPKTQKNYRRQIEIFRSKVGSVMVRSITRQHMYKIKDAYSDRPGAGRTLLKRLNTLFNFAIERGFRPDSPMLKFKLPKEGPGFKSWSDEDIDQYLAHWKSGTRERLALLLCLYTGQRRSDIVKMGYQHVKNEEISVVQQKGGKRLLIPLHKKLREELAHIPEGQLQFLVNPRTGKALSSEGFGNWLRKSAKEAGIEGTRGPHGLRKAACRILIEMGCDGETARAISGHTSEREMKPYIQDVDQRKKARQAMGRWEENS